jgi:hypothetical protein
MRRIVIASVTLFLAVSVLYVGYYVAGAEIDNRLHVLTSRDLDLFQTEVVAGVRLGDLVEQRAGHCQWSAKHDEYIWASNIACELPDHRYYMWEISHVPPRDWLAARRLYLTPLGRDAAALVPELLPQGFEMRNVPSSRYGSGVIYDSVRPDGR